MKAELNEGLVYRDCAGIVIRLCILSVATKTLMRLGNYSAGKY